MGACLGLCTLWKTWWDDKDHLLTATVFASMYWVTQFSAWFYPGSTAFDPPQTSDYSFAQLYFLIVPLMSIIMTAYWLEQRRVAALGGKKAA